MDEGGIGRAKTEALAKRWIWCPTGQWGYNVVSDMVKRSGKVPGTLCVMPITRAHYTDRTARTIKKILTISPLTWKFSGGFRQFDLSVKQRSKCSDRFNEPHKVPIM